ncbi:M64 family metallopeptidase [Pseudoalteromonas sp. T1lg65]|uniref:M64 family metallopeptidase n=1 Tax=Pseudoalteromonas sp. T1lg65 TaxID=2077101 RepID=UPI003F7A72F4
MFKIIGLYFLLFTGVASAIPMSTWRLDLLHSGGNGNTETFIVQQLIAEPLPWSAPLIDHLERGDYRVELFASEQSEPWFSKTYSSLFSDWQRSNETLQHRRSFQESVKFPAPHQNSQLVISKRKRDVSGQPFVPIWKMDINADQKLTAAVDSQKQIIRDLHISGPADSNLDLLFIAEGFKLGDQDAFFNAAQHAMLRLFSFAPFTQLKQSINVRALFTASKDNKLGGDTALSVQPNALGMPRYALTMEVFRLNNLTMQVPHDNIVILTNSSQYSASGIFGTYTVVPAFEPNMAFLLVHELGHHLAGLGDEYFHSTSGYAPSESIIEPHEPNITALLDNKLKWAHLVTPNTPIPTPWPLNEYLTEPHDNTWQKQAKHPNAVGAFKGANYSTQFYRPALNCIMWRNDEHNRFCPVCNQAIKEVIEAHNSSNKPSSQ